MALLVEWNYRYHFYTPNIHQKVGFWIEQFAPFSEILADFRCFVAVGLFSKAQLKVELVKPQFFIIMIIRT